jgi:MoxR-like ATPase
MGSMRDEIALVERLQEAKDRILKEIHKVIVGQDRVIEEILIALFSQGHCLLIGVPGLAKTLLVNTISKVFDLSFKRIQFTPDLMPSDITGTEIIEEDLYTGKRHFKFVKGPIFANIILADEINRTPPKTQAALLEAMQERRVTAGGVTHELPSPFFVLATQNPIEQEGTYPLPEAQLDRFMMNIHVDYPSPEEEVEIVRSTTSPVEVDVEKIMDADEILQLQRIVRLVPASDRVIRYAVSLVRATRPSSENAPQFVRELVSWGAGPRASQYLILGGKARALMMGRYHVSCEDVRAIAMPVLRHRIIPSFNAEAEGIGSSEIIERLIQIVEPPSRV